VRRVRDGEVPPGLRHPNAPAELIGCIGCGALVPNIDGQPNANISGSPGCLAVYEKVRARGGGDPRYAEIQQLTMFTYLLQHPAVAKQGWTQSVAPQLMGLCALLDRGIPVSLAVRAFRDASTSRDSFQSLTQPESCGELTILHVRDATTLHEHIRRVREWSSSVWKAWAPHHPIVQRWTIDAIRKLQPRKTATHSKGIAARHGKSP
jgi:uncharacterized protein DUF5946